MKILDFLKKFIFLLILIIIIEFFIYPPTKKEIEYNYKHIEQAEKILKQIDIYNKSNKEFNYTEILNQLELIYNDIVKEADILNTNIAIFNIILIIISIIVSIIGYYIFNKLQKFEREKEKLKKNIEATKEIIEIQAKIALFSLPDLTKSQQLPYKSIKLLKSIIYLIYNKNLNLESKNNNNKNNLIENNILFYKILIAYYENKITDLKNYINDLNKLKNLININEKLFFCYWKGIVHRQINEYIDSINEFFELYKYSIEKNNKKFKNLSKLGIALTIFKFIKKKEISNFSYNLYNDEYSEFFKLLNKIEIYWYSINNQQIINILRNNEEININNNFIIFISITLFNFLVWCFEEEDGDFVLISMTLFKVAQFLLDKESYISNFNNIINTGDLINRLNIYLRRTFNIVSNFKLPEDDSKNIISNFYYCESIVHHYYGNEKKALEYINKAIDTISDVNKEEIKYVYSENREELIHIDDYIKELQNFKNIIQENTENVLPRYHSFWDELYNERKFLYGIEPSSLAELTLQTINKLNSFKNTLYFFKKRRFNFLEIGCGYGRDLLYIGRNLNDTLASNNYELKFYGIDFSDIAINYLLKFIGQYYNNEHNDNKYIFKSIDFIKESSENIVKELGLNDNNQFDIIYAHFFIHLFPLPVRTQLYEKIFNKLLKPNGYFIFSVLSKNDRLFIMNNNNETNNSNTPTIIYPFSEKPWYSLSFFTRENIIGELEEYGNIDDQNTIERLEIENVDGSLRGTHYISVFVQKEGK